MNPLNTLISSCFEHPHSTTLIDIFENFPTYETSSLSQSSFEKLCRLPLKYSFVSQFYTLGKVLESLFFYRIIEFDSLTANNLLDLQNTLTLITNEIKGSFLSENLLVYSEEIIALIVKKDDIGDEDKKTIIDSSNRKFPLIADFEKNTEEIMFYIKSSYVEDKLFGAQKIYELLFQTNSFEEQLEIASKKLNNLTKMILKDHNTNIVKDKDEKLEFELLTELFKIVMPLIGDSEFNFRVNKDEIAAESPILFESERDVIGLKTIFEEKLVMHCKIFGFEDYFKKYEQIFTLCALIVNYCLPRNLPIELHSTLFKMLYHIYLIFPTFRQNVKEPLLATIILVSSTNDLETKREIAKFLFNLASKSCSKAFLEEILLLSENVKRIIESEIYSECARPIELCNFDLKATFPFEKSIEAGEAYFRLVEVSKPCLIYVGVATQYYDIDVKLSYVRYFEKVSNFEEDLVLYQKDAVDASKYPYRIIVFAKNPGLYRIEFSNKKSWFNSKCIRYKFMLLDNIEFSEEKLPKMITNNDLICINEEELECRIHLDMEIKTNLTSKDGKKIDLAIEGNDIKEISLKLNEYSNSKENFGKKFAIGFKIIYNIFALKKIMVELKINDNDLKIIFSKILNLDENIYKGWRVSNLEFIRDIDYYFERLLNDKIVIENEKALLIDTHYKSKMMQAKILDSFLLENNHMLNTLPNHSELTNLNYDLDLTYEDKWVENIQKGMEGSLNLIEFYSDFIYNVFLLTRQSFKLIIFSQYQDGSADPNPSLLNEEMTAKLKENLINNQMNFEKRTQVTKKNHRLLYMDPPYSSIIEELPPQLQHQPQPQPPALSFPLPLEPKSKRTNRLEDSHSKDSLDTSKSMAAPIHFTQSEIFHSAILDRKKKSFNNLKEWDTTRANFLNIHRGILENINLKMETEIKKSQNFMNTLIRFLRERLHQETSIFQSAPKKVDPLTETQQYNDFSKKLEFFEKMATDKCVKAQEFALLIDKKLLTEKLYPEKEKYDLEIGVLTDTISKTKKKLALLNSDTSEKSAKYSTLFFTMINVPFGKKNEKDLYRREIAFLRTAYVQLETQKKLAKEITEGYKLWFELERNRKEVIEVVLDAYGKKYQENYKVEKDEEEVKSEDRKVEAQTEELKEEVSIVNNKEEIKDFFELVLNEKDVEMMKMNEDGFKKILEEFNLEKVTDFLINFEVKKIKEKPLILKELKASRDQGGIIKNFNQCKLIITVDGFLLCLDCPFEEEEFKKPSMIINLENTATIKVKESGIIEFMRIKPGFLMNTLEKFIFKFDSKDDVDEMLEYINRYNIKEN